MYYPLQASAPARVSKKISHNPQSTGRKIKQELRPDRSTPSIGRCGLNQRDPSTSPRRILLGLSFDALFSPIRREIQALCRFRCLKKQYFYYLERVGLRDSALLAVPVSSEPSSFPEDDRGLWQEGRYEIAAECRVERHFIVKIECELVENERVTLILSERDQIE